MLPYLLIVISLIAPASCQCAAEDYPLCPYWVANGFCTKWGYPQSMLQQYCPKACSNSGCNSEVNVWCQATISGGPCNYYKDNKTDGCQLGYTCDTTGNNYCCPMVDYTNQANILGPSKSGLCTKGYVLVMIPGGYPEGSCVSIQSIPGICAEAVQGGSCKNGCGPGYSCFELAGMLRTILLILGLALQIHGFTLTAADAVSCEVEVSGGPCNYNNKTESCQLGYSCDSGNNYCCPMVDYNNTANILGPAKDGDCPKGYVLVMIPGGYPEGSCVTLQSVPGICAASEQSGPCPDGQGCGYGYACFMLAEVCCPNTGSITGLPFALLFLIMSFLSA